MARIPARAARLGRSTTVRRQTHVDRVGQLRVGRAARGGGHTHEVPVTRLERVAARAHDLAQLAAKPVPGHGISRAPAHGIGDLGRPVIGSTDPSDPHWSVAARPNPRQLGEARTVANSVNQAESRARPRARRDLSTARPARLRIRRRKPCFFLRFRLLGWKVRFTHGLLEEGNRPQRLERRRSRTRRGGAERRELRVGRGPVATRSRNGPAGRPHPDPPTRRSDLPSAGPVRHSARDRGITPSRPARTSHRPGDNATSRSELQS